MNKRNSRDERLIRHGLSFIQIPERENNPTNDKNSVIFSLKNQVGGLARALQVFQVRFILSVFNMLKNYVIPSLNFFISYLINLTERAMGNPIIKKCMTLQSSLKNFRFHMLIKMIIFLVIPLLPELIIKPVVKSLQVPPLI